MVHITSDATVDGLDRDLRFYQTKNDGVLWIETKRNAPSTDFILNTNGSLQFYAEDADYLIKQSKETSLTLSAGDIWLEQKITKTPTDNHNGFLFFGNNNTTSSIKTDQDFVAVLDATNVANFEGDFNLIEGNSLNITSQNIIIVQKSSDSAENSNGTGLSLDVDGDHQSHLTAQENIYIQGVNRGIYNASTLIVKAKNLYININSYASLLNNRNANIGIETEANLDVETDLLYITGAHKGLRGTSVNSTH